MSSTDPDTGNTFTYTLATGTGSADNASFTIAGDALKTAAMFDYETKSTHSIRVRTTDQGAPIFEKAFTINVTTNRAPVLDYVGDQSVNENQALTFMLTATDADGNALTYTSTALPTGATLNATTGAFSWTPTAGQAGSYPITFTVTDNGTPNLTDSEAINVVVAAGSTARIISAGAQDGWVLESTRTSNRGGSLDARATTLRVGDDALNRQYRAILSFDTTTLPAGAVIIAARLKIRLQRPIGTNPFRTHGNLLVDLARGNFSNKAVLQLSDFKAAATSPATATVPNAPAAAWYTATLAPELIDITRTTQLRLRFTKGDNNDRGADYLSFYSGNAPAANRPVLEIEYTLP